MQNSYSAAQPFICTLQKAKNIKKITCYVWNLELPQKKKLSQFLVFSAKVYMSVKFFKICHWQKFMPVKSFKIGHPRNFKCLQNFKDFSKCCREVLGNPIATMVLYLTFIYVYLVALIQHALPVITIMAVWQFVDLGTRMVCVDIYKCNMIETKIMLILSWYHF